MTDVIIILLLFFSIYGWHAWHAKDARGRALDARQRRHGQPRRRALPPPPGHAAEGDSA